MNAVEQVVKSLKDGCVYFTVLICNLVAGCKFPEGIVSSENQLTNHIKCETKDMPVR